MSTNLIRQARDFCRVPRRVNFPSPPRIEVKILPTTRHAALARASVTLIANEVVPLGDFIIFEQDGKVMVAGPRAVRLNYRLGKRVEQAVLAAWNERNTTKGRRNEDRSGLEEDDRDAVRS